MGGVQEMYSNHENVEPTFFCCMPTIIVRYMCIYVYVYHVHFDCVLCIFMAFSYNLVCEESGMNVHVICSHCVEHGGHHVFTR